MMMAFLTRATPSRTSRLPGCLRALVACLMVMVLASAVPLSLTAPSHAVDATGAAVIGLASPGDAEHAASAGIVEHGAHCSCFLSDRPETTAVVGGPMITELLPAHAEAAPATCTASPPRKPPRA